MTKEKTLDVVDAIGGQNSTFDAQEMPVVSQEDAKLASGAASSIQLKYDINEEDMNLLFNSMLTVFMRGQFLKQQGFEPNGKDDN